MVCIHDYYYICGKVGFINIRKKIVDIWRELFKRSSKNIVPSDAVNKIYTDAYKYRFDTIYHEETIKESIYFINERKCINVCCIGGFNNLKGVNDIYKCSSYCIENKLDIKFYVIGYIENIKHDVPGLSIMGQYNDSREVPSILKDVGCDILWLPSLSETYSYVLSIMLRAGYPCLLRDIDIFRERGNDKGIYYHGYSAKPKEIIDNILNIKKDIHKGIYVPKYIINDLHSIYFSIFKIADRQKDI